MEKVSKTIKENAAKFAALPRPDGQGKISDVPNIAKALEDIRRAAEGLEEWLEE